MYLYKFVAVTGYKGAMLLDGYQLLQTLLNYLKPNYKTKRIRVFFQN